VDPAMEEQCKRKLEDKGQWGQEKLMNLLIWTKEFMHGPHVRF
jgi:hypothetical protein